VSGDAGPGAGPPPNRSAGNGHLAAAAAGNGHIVDGGEGTTVSWALRSDPGRIRAHNEDCAGAWWKATDDPGPERGPLFVLCDGLGGHAAGEVASRLAVDTALAAWAAPGPPAAHQAVRAAARAANLAVYDASLRPGRRGMGTTLTALTLAGREALVAHVGDSRAYLVRDGHCSQLTADHSRVGEMLRMGLLTPEQAARHPARSQLTRTIGTDITVQVDLVRTPSEVGDVFVLCSDGLWDEVSRAEVASAVDPGGGRAPGVGAVADALVDLAIARESPDNVSVVVVRVVATQPGPAAEPRRSRLRKWRP
jgi:serine/threonine protein phosphatase PrpC